MKFKMAKDKSIFGIKAEGKTWSLKAMLDIPEEKKIPKSLLREIKNTELGQIITNPTDTGKRKIKVTNKLKQKSLAVYNLNY